MKKDRPPPCNRKVPEPLNVFSKRTRLRGGGSKETLRELLTSLVMIPERHPGCLSFLDNLNKCDEINGKVEEPNQDYNGSDENKQIEEPIKKESSNLTLGDDDTESTDDGEGIQRLNSLLDEVGLSCDGKWLRRHLKFPLKMAVKEIVAKKPFDPVGYLGFWLLNYRKRQEIDQWHLEEQQELDYYRSLVRKPVSEVDEQVSVDKGEEEEEARDWNFKYYGAASIVT